MTIAKEENDFTTFTAENIRAKVRYERDIQTEEVEFMNKYGIRKDQYQNMFDYIERVVRMSASPSNSLDQVDISLTETYNMTPYYNNEVYRLTLSKNFREKLKPISDLFISNLQQRGFSARAYPKMNKWKSTLGTDEFTLTDLHIVVSWRR
jgi:hypothetical protein